MFRNFEAKCQVIDQNKENYFLWTVLRFLHWIFQNFISIEFLKSLLLNVQCEPWEGVCNETFLAFALIIIKYRPCYELHLVVTTCIVSWQSVQLKKNLQVCNRSKFICCSLVGPVFSFLILTLLFHIGFRLAIFRPSCREIDQYYTNMIEKVTSSNDFFYYWAIPLYFYST